MFHSTPVVANKSKRRRNSEEDLDFGDLACAIVKDDQDDEIKSYLLDEGSYGSTPPSTFDYSNLTFSDSNDYSSDFSFTTPAPVDSIRKKLLEHERQELEGIKELNERRDIFADDGALTDEDEKSDDENEFRHRPDKSLIGKGGKLAVVRKLDAVVYGKEPEKTEFNVNNLVEMTYKSFSLNEDLNNNNLDEVGVSDEDEL
ncbi:uncharacterized protein LOC134831178 [Culicoides brevitarsis]|uniref:uncharacterized protein LOC134831178 n=1 Tax=Culicoides brevitarsis TaxID=469753 RepID=UPI00307C6105